jgi:hypothetical protein
MSMVIYILYAQGPRFVESHICQNRADMGHPSFVTDRDLTTGPSFSQGVCEKCGLGVRGRRQFHVQHIPKIVDVDLKIVLNAAGAVARPRRVEIVDHPSL